MILPFPKKPEDWLEIWQLTKSMTLLTAKGDLITITIVSARSFQSDELGNLEVVKIRAIDGEFYISFVEPIETLSNKLVFQVDDLDPKAGQWHIPQEYIDKHN